jgi:hypothetical protein
VRDRLELCERCPRVDGNVRAGSRCKLQVALQYRRTDCWGDLLEPHGFATAVAEYRMPARRPDISDPVDALAKHRHDVALALVVGHNDRKRAQLSRPPPPHLQSVKAGANGGPPHIHLFQEERFIVHTGELNVRRGRDRITVGAGEEIRIPPKVVHTFQAETESTYTVEFRPGLRIEEFFRELYALPTDRRGNPRIGDAARLMRAYPDEFLYFPLVPVSVQRALAVPLSKLGSDPR